MGLAKAPYGSLIDMTQQEVLDILKGRKLTCKEMAAKLGANKWAVQESLSRLMRWGCIDRKPSGNFKCDGSFIYFVKNDKS